MLKQEDLLRNLPWQVTIIYDACRYDAFELMNPFKGTLYQVYGLASHTYKFYEGIFEMKDVTLVSATPHAHNFRHKFGKYVPVWKFGWDNYYGVHPETMKMVVFKLLQEDPNQRMLIHFLQPHFPLIGYPSLAWGMQGLDFLRATEFSKQICYKRHEYFIHAYLANLALVIGTTANLLPYLDGMVIITTDHGTRIGETWPGGAPGDLCGHNPAERTPYVRHIPFLIMRCERQIDLGVVDRYPEILEKWGIHENLRNVSLEGSSYRSSTVSNFKGKKSQVLRPGLKVRIIE